MGGFFFAFVLIKKGEKWLRAKEKRRVREWEKGAQRHTKWLTWATNVNWLWYSINAIKTASFFLISQFVRVCVCVVARVRQCVICLCIRHTKRDRLLVISHTSSYPIFVKLKKSLTLYDDKTFDIKKYDIVSSYMYTSIALLFNIYFLIQIWFWFGLFTTIDPNPEHDCSLRKLELSIPKKTKPKNKKKMKLKFGRETVETEFQIHFSEMIQIFSDIFAKQFNLQFHWTHILCRFFSLSKQLISRTQAAAFTSSLFVL